MSYNPTMTSPRKQTSSIHHPQSSSSSSNAFSSASSSVPSYHKSNHGLLSPPSSGRQRDSNGDKLPSRFIQGQYSNPDCRQSASGSDHQQQRGGNDSSDGLEEADKTLEGIRDEESQVYRLSTTIGHAGMTVEDCEQNSETGSYQARSRENLDELDQLNSHAKSGMDHQEIGLGESSSLPTSTSSNPSRLSLHPPSTSSSSTSSTGKLSFPKDWIRDALHSKPNFNPTDSAGKESNHSISSTSFSATSDLDSDPSKPTFPSSASSTSPFDASSINVLSRNTFVSKSLRGSRRSENAMDVDQEEDEDNPFLVKKASNSVNLSEELGMEHESQSSIEYKLPTYKMKRNSNDDSSSVEGDGDENSPSFGYHEKYQLKNSQEEEEEEEYHYHPTDDEERDHHLGEEEEGRFQSDVEEELDHQEFEPIRDSPFNPFLAGGRCDFGRNNGRRRNFEDEHLRKKRKNLMIDGNRGRSSSRVNEKRRRDETLSGEDDELEMEEEDEDESFEDLEKDIPLDEKKLKRMNGFGSRNRGVTVYVFRGTQVTYQEPEPSDDESEDEEDQVLVDSQQSNHDETYRHDRFKIKPRPDRFKPKLLFPEAHEQVRIQREREYVGTSSASGSKKRNRNEEEDDIFGEKEIRKTKSNSRIIGSRSDSAEGKDEEKKTEINSQSSSLLEALDRTGWEDDDDDDDDDDSDNEKAFRPF